MLDWKRHNATSPTCSDLPCMGRRRAVSCSSILRGLIRLSARGTSPHEHIANEVVMKKDCVLYQTKHTVCYVDREPPSSISSLQKLVNINYTKLTRTHEKLQRPRNNVLPRGPEPSRRATASLGGDSMNTNILHLAP